MIFTHIQNTISELGYIDMEVAYSLGYCQGDGVAWYGTLDHECLMVLLPRLLADRITSNEASLMLNVLRDYRHYEVIKIYRNDHRYAHENTMSIENTIDFESLIEDDDDAMRDAGVNKDILARWESLWQRFILALGRDMRKHSIQLRNDGYAIIESTSREESLAWSYTTPGFLVELKELPIDFFDMTADVMDFEESALKDMTQSLIKGEGRYVNLKATVSERAHNTVVGTDIITGVFVDGDDCSYAGMRYEVIRSAIAEARSYVAGVLKAYRSLKAA
jgi:hypothetical protein